MVSRDKRGQSGLSPSLWNCLLGIVLHKMQITHRGLNPAVAQAQRTYEGAGPQDGVDGLGGNEFSPVGKSSYVPGRLPKIEATK